MLSFAGKGVLTPILAVAVCSDFTVYVRAAGLDTPHVSANDVSCPSCHQMTSTYPKLLPPLDHSVQHIDDTLANNTCLSCHNDINAPLVATHSSLQTDNGYGNWTVECWVCHNQHIQEQNCCNGSTYGKYVRAPETGYTPISQRILYVRNNQVTCQAGTPNPPGCP